MNETFKTELAAFARDVREICRASGHDGCTNCPLRFNGGKDGCAASDISEEKYNFDQAFAVVEAYRRRKKPCAEVIDRALDVYTIEVEVERDCDGVVLPAKLLAAGAKFELQDYYKGLNRPATARVLSAKRFVLESHREEEDED